MFSYSNIKKVNKFEKLISSFASVFNLIERCLRFAETTREINLGQGETPYSVLGLQFTYNLVITPMSIS